jgi:histidine triad (HIT) family protein
MFLESCVFCRIVRGQATATIVYRDELVVAFRDIHQAAPTHILIVPIGHISSLNDLGQPDEPLLGHMIRMAHELAVRENVDGSGYRIVINTGPEAGQSVSHLHLHLLAGRRMQWPPG